MINRKLVKRILMKLLSTQSGSRILSQFLSDSGRFLLQDCGDHFIAYDPYDWIGENIFKYGQFQRKRTEGLIEFLVNMCVLSTDLPKVLVEVGANIGTQSIYLMRSGVFSQLVALEPNPKCFELLRINILSNGLADISTLLEIAAGSEEAEALLHTRKFNLGASSLRAPRKKRGSKSRVHAVKVHRLETTLAEQSVKPEDIGLIWIDAEGFEIEVLRGLNGSLSAVPAIYFEYTPISHVDTEKKYLSDLIFSNYKNVYLHASSGMTKIDPKGFQEIDGQVDILMEGSIA